MAGTLSCLATDFASRSPEIRDLSANGFGLGRELFGAFRATVGNATEGACAIL